MSAKGSLYLFPTLLSETTLERVIPEEVRQKLITFQHFIVENEKTARYFLKKAGILKPLQELVLYPLNEHTEASVLKEYIKPLLEGTDVGLLSEAGCPGVADPGADIVHLAHKNQIKVIPFTGPSSILLALMASGFNGQQFTFLGYLPRDRADRTKRLKEIEKRSFKHTQLFIEAPYRNVHIFEDMLLSLDESTECCIACDLTGAEEFVQSDSIKNWKKRKDRITDLIHKKPTIFLLYRR